MPEGRYAASARWLHWLTAGSIVVILVAGVWMTFFEPADEAFKLRLYTVHQSFGVVVFVLVLARLWVRWRNPPPALPPMPVLMRAGAHLNHAALYIVLLVQPVLGFLATNAWGFPLRWFDLVPIPSPVGLNEKLAETLSYLHWLGALALLVLLGMHIGAVIFHTFVRKDGLLARMA